MIGLTCAWCEPFARNCLIVSGYVTGQMTFDQAADLRGLADARGLYNSSLYIVALATLEQTCERKETST